MTDPFCKPGRTGDVASTVGHFISRSALVALENNSKTMYPWVHRSSGSLLKDMKLKLM